MTKTQIRGETLLSYSKNSILIDIEALFVCWKVVFFWKVNSGESEFRCLVVY